MRRYITHWKSLCALLLAAALMPGCILELLTTTAIQGELQAQSAASATAQLDRTRRMADEMKIRQAIDVYRAENRENPPSLEALVPNYLDAVPVGPTGDPIYTYDPATGWFGMPSQAGASSGSVAPMTAQDEANLDAIAGALYDYHAMYRRYPDRLADLAPRFIDAVPNQASGQPYRYFPETGEVYHPAELQTAASPHSGPGSTMPISGSSPVADQMQAIGIMNDLNAGSNPNADRARQQAQDIGAQQNERYESVLDDLNL